MTCDTRESGENSNRIARVICFAILSITLIVVIGVRIRLLNVPLERDEGEYAYGGQLLLHGVPLYKGFYTMKWPGTQAMYTLIMALFGQTTAGIHTGLIVVNLATTLLVFFLARRLFAIEGAVVAAGTYALLSINPSMLGLAAHATHFVLLPALGGILLVQNLGRDTSRGRILIAGLLLGIAALMKQTGAVFGLFAAVWIGWWEFEQSPRDLRRLATRLGFLAFGGILPIALLCIAVAAGGQFHQFWFWTVRYALEYASEQTPMDGLGYLLEKIGPLFASAPGIWAATVLGVILIISAPSLRKVRAFIGGLALFSFLGTCPDWLFREHYFLLLLPAAALLVGAAGQFAHDQLAALRNSTQATAAVLLLFIAAGVSALLPSANVFYYLSPREVSRALYASSLFPEQLEAANYLKAHCRPGAPVAVLGSEPEVYFYSRLRAVTGFLYVYPLMERQPYAVAMQGQMAHEIETGDPDYVVFVHSTVSWMQRPNSPMVIYDWFRKYRTEKLQLAAWIEVKPPDHTEYHWSASESTFEPESQFWIAIFRRKVSTSADSKAKSMQSQIKPSSGNPLSIASTGGASKELR